MSYLAVDVGGTKIEVCRIYPDFRIEIVGRIMTYRFTRGSLAFLDDLIYLIESFFDRKDRAICISFNCLVKNNFVMASSLLGSENVDICEKISQKFDVPCVVENDVVCQALAEQRFGCGRDYSNFVLVNLGTGLRIVSINDEQLLSGVSNQAGEVENIFSHKINGIVVERCLSGRGIVHMYQAFGGQSLTAKEIFESVDIDPVAKEAVGVFSDKFAELLHMMSCFYNPDLIVVTGSMADSLGVFLPRSWVQYRSRCVKYFQVKAVQISEVTGAACLGAVISFLNRF